jgi:hypothetical protein
VNWPDAVNGAFELSGGAFVALNCLDIWRKKMVAGATVPVALFFLSWGLWNIAYYPHLGQWFSMAGGLFLAGMNGVLLWMIVKFRGGAHA